MKSLILLTIVLAISLLLKAQVEIKVSMAIVAICSDGIVMGTDSRGSIYTKTQSATNMPIAYFDSLQKSSYDKNYMFCTMNTFIYKNKFMNYYYDKFKITIPAIITIDEVAFRYRKFLKDSLPGIYNNLKSYVAGYFNNEPKIVIIDFNGKIKSDSGIYYFNYIVSKPNSGFESLYSKNYTCAQLAKIIEKVILDYAKKKKKEHLIGGDIQVLKISPNTKIEWILNPPNE